MAYRFTARPTTPGAYRLAPTVLSRLVALGDIRLGVGRGDGGIGTLVVAGGTSTDPGVENVEDGIAYMINDVPLAGTLELPSTANVAYGVWYGAGGAEFQGTYSAGTTIDSPASNETSSGVANGSDATADLIDALKLEHAVDVLVDGRVYGGVVPVGVEMPFVWIQRRGVQFVAAMGEVEDEPWKETFDVECVSENGLTVIEVSDAVRRSLNGLQGQVGEGVYSWISVSDAAETYVPRNTDAGENLFVSSLDVEVIRP